jgi:RNA polymerase sigma factor (sigma-70 family)
MPDVSDMELLQQYHRQDSEEAFAELVRRHINLVYSTAYRHLGIPAHAEEIAQAVFIILARKAAGLRPDAVLEAWLYETTRLASLNFQRGEWRRQRREQEAYMQSTLPESADLSVWNQLAPLLDEAMSRLERKDREAVVLRFFKEKSFGEVALALKITEATAQSRVHRAVEKLRLFFTKRGVVHSAEVLTATISAHSVQAAPAALAKTVAAIALAKGAAAGASTLTLSKGALKVMAWTKAKTTTVAAVAVILALATTAVIVSKIHATRAAAYPDLQGVWEGVLPLGGAGVAKGDESKTRLVLKFSKTNGRYTAVADALDGAERNIPVAVAYHYPSLRLAVNPRAEFDAKINADGTELVINGNAVLKRTTTPDPVPDPVSEDDCLPRKGSDLQGYWKGTMGDSPNGLPLSWRIAQQADGTYHAEMDNPMQGALKQPVSVIYSRPTVKLTVATGNGMFQGDINGDNTVITGAFILGGESTPMTVKRADYQAEHEQDAAKDYSSRSESELQGHWQGTWILPYGPVKVKMRFALDIARMPDGALLAALANLDQLGNSDPIPASDFHYSAPNIRMAWKWAGGRFEGKLKNGKLSGTWSQGGGGFPLVFERRH